MGIFRVCKNKDNPYVMLNKGFLNDPNLSFREKGILAYLLSKPDDWKVYQKELEKASTEGRESIRAAIKNLLYSGYLKRHLRKGERGRFSGWDYEVYEVPQKQEKEEASEAEFVVKMFELHTGREADTKTREEAIEMAEKAIEKSKPVLAARNKWGRGG